LTDYDSELAHKHSLTTRSHRARDVSPTHRTALPAALPTARHTPLVAPHVWPITAAVDDHGHLTIGGIDAVDLAETFGTPLYVIDEATFRDSARRYREALARHYPGPSAVHYAGKALLNSAVARLATDEGLGLDVVSGGELFVAIRAGVPADQIHFHGNAKTRSELEDAVTARVGNITIDNLDELELLASITADHTWESKLAGQSIALRLAPGVSANTHAHIQTGQRGSKFGLPLELLDAAVERIIAARGLRLTGLHVHLGSQIVDAEPYGAAIGVLLSAAARLRDRYGLTIQELSPGGGLGAAYLPDDAVPDIDGLVARVARTLVAGSIDRGLPLPTLVLEPGRSIIARAGVALYRVLATKRIPDAGVGRADRFVHVDGGMGDNIRPALYGARYMGVVANKVTEPAGAIVHVSGRYCESSDVIMRDVAMPDGVGPGDLVAVAAAGAYTLSMANNYNLTLRPAVVMVREGRARLAQRRETHADLVARDVESGW
jgi:diaminopimelate decarboxylase